MGLTSFVQLSAELRKSCIVKTELYPVCTSLPSVHPEKRH